MICRFGALCDSMAGLITILIDFHVYLSRRQRILLTTQVKTTWSFINHSFCEFTDWCHLLQKWHVHWTNPWRFRSHNC